MQHNASTPPQPHTPHRNNRQTRTRRATIGLTLGEDAGIGPEVMADALIGALQEDVHVLVCVGAGMSEWAAGLLPAESADRWTILEATTGPAGGPVTLGKPTKTSQNRAFAALALLVETAKQRRVDAIVTGPVTKAIFDEVRPRPPGQTEYVARHLGAAKFAMMLAGPKLRVVPVTTHVALRDVPSLLTTEKIVTCAEATAHDLRQHFGIAAPVIGVCGLNPHAGEGGLLGDEERTLIAPAVARLRGLGIAAVGPVSADSAFGDGLDGRFDAVVCMYHDQALGPLKTVHRRTAINFTCGLPVPRMSPDHGTAFELAGKNLADPTSACLAVERAVMIAQAAAKARAAESRPGADGE